jgi:UDP-N-acetylmuramoylalanine--D-glutamate ligase
MDLDEKLKQLRGKSVIVIGAGVSGIAACKFLAKLGAKIILADDADIEIIQKRLHSSGEIPACISLQQGISSSVTSQAELIILSPGISQNHVAIQYALLRGIPVINEIDLGAAFLPKCQFVGITGTNGKSTTTTILGSIAKTYDANTFVGGNLGTPLCEILAKGILPKIAILELSSYQLELLNLIKLDAAVVTNLTPDHLDRYPSAEAYYLAKAKIFSLLQTAGIAILNQQDPNSKKFLFDRTAHSRLDFNVKPEDIGIAIQSNTILVNTPNFKTSLILSRKQFLGQHNYQNAAAAVAASLALKVPLPTIQAGLDAYMGIAHRLEFLGCAKGVRWINDSKATNVESVLIAMENFSEGVHLIVGGIGKKSSYAPLAKICRGRVKAIYAIGEDAPNLLDAFKEFVCIDAKTLENAVLLARKKAQKGDTILLSPACASWDQFESFAHRGDCFRKLFQKAQETA